MKDRANAALGNLQRKAFAMSMLRSKIESRINLLVSSGVRTDDVQELDRLLQLVRNGELIIKDLSNKVESARFLEEFVQIINGAAESVSEIKDDVEELVPMAEAALAEMHDAISHVSKVMVHGSGDEIDPSIMLQISAELKAVEEPGINVPPAAENVSKLQSIDSKKQQAQDELEEIAI